MGDQFQIVNGLTVKLRNGDALIRIHAEDLIQFLETAPRFPNGTINLVASKLAFRDRKGYTHEKPCQADERWDRAVLKTA